MVESNRKKRSSSQASCYEDRYLDDRPYERRRLTVLEDVTRCIYSQMVVEVVLACLQQQHLKIMVKVGKTAGWYAARAATTADDDVHLLWDSHDVLHGMCKLDEARLRPWPGRRQATIYSPDSSALEVLRISTNPAPLQMQDTRNRMPWCRTIDCQLYKYQHMTM